MNTNQLDLLALDAATRLAKEAEALAKFDLAAKLTEAAEVKWMEIQLAGPAGRWGQ